MHCYVQTDAIFKYTNIVTIFFCIYGWINCKFSDKIAYNYRDNEFSLRDCFYWCTLYIACFEMNMTYLFLEVGRIRQQIHILECPEEVRRKVPKSAVNTLLSSE